MNTHPSTQNFLLPFCAHPNHPSLKHWVYKICKVEHLHINSQELCKWKNKFWSNHVRIHLSS
jgi:hypothetical protein